MGFRVIVSGVAIECESADDALLLARKAARQSSREKVGEASADVDGTGWTEKRVKAFWARLKDNQKKLMGELLNNLEGRTDQELLRLLKMEDGKRLAGVFTALFKNAAKVGADPEDLYHKETTTSADGRVRKYTVSDAFRKAWEGMQSKAKK